MTTETSTQTVVEREAKRRRVHHSRTDVSRVRSVFGLARPHPLGVRPLGNALLLGRRGRADSRKCLGRLAALPDALLAALIADSALLGDADVARLGAACRALYAFAGADDVWRARCIARFGGFGAAGFGASWRSTFRQNLSRRDSPECPVDVDTAFCSDLLFSAWRCAAVPLQPLCRVATDNIARRTNLSLADFVKEFDQPAIPVILSDVVPNWPAYTKWSMPYLKATVGDVVFRAESVDLPFNSYATYAERCNNNNCSNYFFEEAPLYLFDKHFAERTNLSDDFSVPPYFSQDLFKLLGQNERPDYRWIIIGPARSGSTFHLDPNSTSAWNAVITGAKKWILFPPNCVPPGVFPSKDGSEVVTPISLAEWFLNHYDDIQSCPVKPIECVCRAGEILYVPRGWWHCVMNLEESIAITQNFVNECNLEQVLNFIRTKPDQISGYGSGPGAVDLCNTLYDRFSNALQTTEEFKYAVEKELQSSETREVSFENKTKLCKAAGEGLSSLFSSTSSSLHQDLEQETASSFRFGF
ncbi:hypothetical protein HK100_006620 [Physocladia obscura]|uniref:JmjC domain-containing protein n=1 Tax=Physocladia obscura TaxID=109957 RepID=A0AAD5XCJ4_9FUNG|nr:hypothetical protein HK100_006620 [Physocladia obscura]